MMGACGADDDVGVLLRQKFKKQRFQMIDDTLHPNNGDEARYANRSFIGNATKGFSPRQHT